MCRFTRSKTEFHQAPALRCTVTLEVHAPRVFLNSFSLIFAYCLSSISPSSSSAGICEAAAEGDLEAVRAFIAAGVDPNSERDEEGRTPLFAAISEGHEEVALELLRHPGIDVSLGRCSTEVDDGQQPVVGEVSPLCAAAHEGQSVVVEALLTCARQGICMSSRE